MTQRILNARQTPEAELQLEEKAVLDRAVALTPGRVILPTVPPFGDQGSTGTCVAWAARAVYMWQYRQQFGRWPELDVFVFYDLMKRIDGEPDPDRVKGTYLLTALRVMKGSGYPKVGGGRYPRITSYQFVEYDADSHNRAIDQLRRPVLMRGSWDAQWFYLPRNRILKPPIGQIVGGHAMAEFGFDDTLVRPGETTYNLNSWGAWSVDGRGVCYFADRYQNPRGLEGWVIGSIET